MKQQIGLAVVAAALFAASAGAALAQNSSNGTLSGANTNDPAAGTGNAGDRTAQPGTTPPAPKHVRHHHRRHHHAKAASAPQ